VAAVRDLLALFRAPPGSHVAALLGVAANEAHLALALALEGIAGRWIAVRVLGAEEAGAAALALATGEAGAAALALAAGDALALDFANGAHEHERDLFHLDVSESTVRALAALALAPAPAPAPALVRRHERVAGGAH